MKLKCLLVVVAVLALGIGAAADQVFNGTLFYTDFCCGVDNVNKVQYSYDQTTQKFSMGSQVVIGSTPGADGIIFAPNGDLLVGGQGTNHIYEVNPGTGTITFNTALQDQSYHLALDPSGTKVYTSNFGGPLLTAGLTSGHLDGTSTLTPISGGDSGVTQIAFAGGKAFYDTSFPNCCGDFGLINLATGATTKLGNGTAVHGMIYDSFTGLITFFGDGWVGTLNPTTLAFSEAQISNCDFDQGAVDGFGHALIAGCGSVTFVDYSGSHNIEKPNFITSVGGFGNIDDVAPLSGVGSRGSTPEPGSLLLVGSGLLGLSGLVRRRNSK